MRLSVEIIVLFIYAGQVYSKSLPFDVKWKNEVHYDYFGSLEPVHIFRADRPIKYEKPAMNFIQLLEPVEDTMDDFHKPKPTFLTLLLTKIQSRFDAGSRISSLLPVLPIAAGLSYLLYTRAATPVVKMRSTSAIGKTKNSLAEIPVILNKVLLLPSLDHRDSFLLQDDNNELKKPPEATYGRSGCQLCNRGKNERQLQLFKGTNYRTRNDTPRTLLHLVYNRGQTLL